MFSINFLQLFSFLSIHYLYWFLWLANAAWQYFYCGEIQHQIKCILQLFKSCFYTNNLMEINFFANNGATYKIENSKIGVAAIELITSSYWTQNIRICSFIYGHVICTVDNKWIFLSTISIALLGTVVLFWVSHKGNNLAWRVITRKRRLTL